MNGLFRLLMVFIEEFRNWSMNFSFLLSWLLFSDSLYFSIIVLRSSNFLVTDVNDVYFSVVDWIFWLIFLVRSFDVCYTFAGFVYVYCLVHQSLVLFCFVFRLRSAVMFFNFCKIHFCFVFHRRSAVQLILVMFLSVLCSFEDVLFSFFVFVNFSNVLRCKYFHVSVIFYILASDPTSEVERLGS